MECGASARGRGVGSRYPTRVRASTCWSEGQPLTPPPLLSPLPSLPSPPIVFYCIYCAPDVLCMCVCVWMCCVQVAVKWDHISYALCDATIPGHHFVAWTSIYRHIWQSRCTGLINNLLHSSNIQIAVPVRYFGPLSDPDPLDLLRCPLRFWGTRT